jgi:hypothetical protein
MAEKGESSGPAIREKEDVEKLLGRLNLHEDEDDGFVWEDEAPDPTAKAKWLAVAKVHTSRGFSSSALYADMRSAWNPAKEVVWRKIDDNLFTVQFGCLGDWEKAMYMGPWLFRNNYALMMEKYDGFQNPRSIALNKVAVWTRVMQLPDNYLKEPVIRGMCRKVGEVREVQITLPAGYIGEFVRVRIKIDVEKKLNRFVSVTRDKKKDWYQLKYEKLPVFCGACGLLGHWYQECGTGEHDESKLEWGSFLLADGGRGSGRGWSSGRGSFGGRGPQMGRGRGVEREYQPAGGFTHDPHGSMYSDMDEDLPGRTNGRKRSTLATILSEVAPGAASTVANIVNQLEPGNTGKELAMTSPGKNQPPKRSRKDDDLTNPNISATSGQGVVREQ